MILSEAKTQVIKDYPGRFVLEAEQIKYLVQEMNESLYPDNPEQISQNRFIFGLQNGVVRQTDNLDELLNQENNRQQRITFLIIVSELLGKSDETTRRYLVHFGSGEKIFGENGLEFPGKDWFNLNFEGVSYRILDSNRSTAMDMMKKFDDRIPDFFRWYSNSHTLVDMDTRAVLKSFFFWIAFGFLSYASSHLRTSSDVFTIQFSTGYISAVATSILILLSVLTIFLASLKTFEWLLPPSYFAIGQGKKAYQNTFENWRQFFWAVPVAIAVSILVWLFGF